MPKRSAARYVGLYRKLPQVQSAVVGKYEHEEDYFVNVAYRDGGCNVYDDICEARTTWWLLANPPTGERVIAADNTGAYL